MNVLILISNSRSWKSSYFSKLILLSPSNRVRGKKRARRSVTPSVISDSCNLRDCSPPGFLYPWDFSAKNTVLEWVAVSFFRGSSWSKDQTHVSCLADGFFTTEPLGKPIYCLITIKISGSSRDSGWINLWRIKLKANSNSIALCFI